MSGILGKAGFRIEGNRNGLPSDYYPCNESDAGDVEVKLGAYDQVPIESESLDAVTEFEQDETIDGLSSTPNIDAVLHNASGSIKVNCLLQGLTGLMGASLGFENWNRPYYLDGGYSGTVTKKSTTTIMYDETYPWVGIDLSGYWVRVLFQVRRIISNTSGTITVSPAFDFLPTIGHEYQINNVFTHTFELAYQMSEELWVEILPGGIGTPWAYPWPTYDVFTQNDRLIKRGTLAIKRLKTGESDVFISTMVNSIRMNFEAVNLAKFDVSINSFINDYAGTVINPDLDDLAFNPIFNSVKSIDFSNCVFQVREYTESTFDSNHEIGIQSFEIGVNNFLKTDDNDAHSLDRVVQPTRAGKREITGSFSLPRYFTQQFRDWYHNKTELSGLLTGTDNDGNFIKIWVCKFLITGLDVNAESANVIKQTIQFQAINPNEQVANFPTMYLINPFSEILVQLKNNYPFNPFLDQNREY